MNKVFYLIKSAFSNMYHHRKVAFSLVLSLIILISANLFLLMMHNNLQNVLEVFNKNLRIELILKKDINNEDIKKNINNIKNNNLISVEEIVVNDAAENLKNFVNSSEIIEKIYPLLDKNPLPATIAIKINFNKISIENIDRFIDKIDNNTISTIIYPKEWFNKSLKIAKWSEYIAYGLIGLFFVLTYILWIHIFKVSLFSVKKEIEIMEIVGGTKTYIKTPFVIETFIYAVISFLISLGIMKYIYVGADKLFNKILFLTGEQILYAFVLTVLITLLGTEKAIGKFFKK
ncbi:MAG: FtsX-like permease family protein [Candidatus Mcinerneyibacterium aminivorans]|uniref:FtsX-like permease family protein n=1 Tax=Candidatus Mcinerneyibacterium aminivorans TaxID=2703815 RepID=A0A5D0MDG5_9BACT|nr:MAG: FtsX-like permease family protein [Candidatus Mcinerneyibacterium aminivorans]